MSTTHVRLGQGAGWCPQIDGALALVETLGFIEVVAESIGSVGLPAGVAAARERGLHVVPHGVSLSLGGAERPDRGRLAHLASVAERVQPPLVSEHIAFARAGDAPRSGDALRDGLAFARSLGRGGRLGLGDDARVEVLLAHAQLRRGVFVRAARLRRPHPRLLLVARVPRIGAIHRSIAWPRGLR